MRGFPWESLENKFIFLNRKPHLLTRAREEVIRDEVKKNYKRKGGGTTEHEASAKNSEGHVDRKKRSATPEEEGLGEVLRVMEQRGRRSVHGLRTQECVLKDRQGAGERGILRSAADSGHDRRGARQSPVHRKERGPEGGQGGKEGSFD